MTKTQKLIQFILTISVIINSILIYEKIEKSKKITEKTNEIERYGKITKEIKKQFENIIKDPTRILEDEESLEFYSKDHSHHNYSRPELIISPINTEEISKIMEICFKNHIPVTPSGGRTGLEGGSIPKFGGLVLNLKLMDKVLKLIQEDLHVVVQPGLYKKDLNVYLEPLGFFFPVDPGSDATIGGYTSTGASGTLTPKYGTMRDNVVSLQVVLPDGKIIKTRSRSPKSSAGYDLTKLFIGSEGTLGIITEITLKIKKLPPSVCAAQVFFPTLEDAASAVQEIISAELSGLSRCEILNVEALKAVNKYFNKTYPETPTLFLEFFGSTDEFTKQQAFESQKLTELHKGYGFELSTEKEEREDRWHARRSAYYASYKYREGKARLFSTDVCVPVSKFAKVVSQAEKWFKESNTSLPCPLVGHSYDGNFHLLIPYFPDEFDDLLKLNYKIVHLAIENDGTCTGEHGVGMGKRDELIKELGEETVNVMRKIKKGIDPNYIMNPEKIFVYQ